LDENDFGPMPTDDTDSELLCQSLETVLMETLLELRKQRQQQTLNSNSINKSIKEDQQSISTRL